MDGVGTILGDVFMQAFNIDFDRQNRRIGFTPVSNCSGMVSMSVLSGDRQKGSFGWGLSEPLQVKVVYRDNSFPVAGIFVEWQVTDGSASLSSSLQKSLTNSDGIASMYISSLRAVGTIVIVASIGDGSGSSLVTFKVSSSAWKVVSVVLLSAIAVSVALLAAVYISTRIKRRLRRGNYRANSKEIPEEELFVNKDELVSTFDVHTDFDEME